MTLRHSLLATLVATIWGFNFVVIEWGMHDVPPLLFVSLRFAAVLVPAIFFVPRPVAPWRTIAAVGVFMSLGQFGFLYTAMNLGLPPGIAALVLQAQVMFTVVIAAFVLSERPTRNQAIGTVVGAAGLAVVGIGRGGHIPLLALVLCLAGALSWGIGNVVSRKSGVRSGLSMSVWSSVVVPVPLFLLSLTVDGPHAVGVALSGLGWEAIVSTLYTAALSSLVGYSIFNGLLARYHTSSVVPFVLLAPPVAMVSAWLLLGETLNSAEAIGGLVVLGGVLLTVWRSERAATLGVRRARTVDVGERGNDPASGEVGTALVDLLDRAEAGRANLAKLADDVLGDRGVVHATVEHQADRVVPAAPRGQPIGQQQRARGDLEAELLLDLPADGQVR
ncbi:MAG: EamA family transporter [Marmoricola sp.]|nr:EamA family transporter [Marmoricola sp.]